MSYLDYLLICEYFISRKFLGLSLSDLPLAIRENTIDGNCNSLIGRKNGRVLDQKNEGVEEGHGSTVSFSFGGFWPDTCKCLCFRLKVKYDGPSNISSILFSRNTSNGRKLGNFN